MRTSIRFVPWAFLFGGWLAAQGSTLVYDVENATVEMAPLPPVSDPLLADWVQASPVTPIGLMIPNFSDLDGKGKYWFGGWSGGTATPDSPRLEFSVVALRTIRPTRLNYTFFSGNWSDTWLGPSALSVWASTNGFETSILVGNHSLERTLPFVFSGNNRFSDDLSSLGLLAPGQVVSLRMTAYHQGPARTESPAGLLKKTPENSNLAFEFTPVEVPTNCAVQLPGLVSWWTGNGTAEDSVGTNHGSLRLGAGFAPGLFGNAFSFDGIDDFVEVPHSDSLNIDPQGDSTLEFWFYRTSPEAAQQLVGKRIDCGNVDTAANYQAAFDAGTPQIPSLKWVHWAQVLSNGVLTVYTNGQILPNPTGSRVGPVNQATLRFGGSGDCGAPFRGLIDEIRFYHRALSPGEIRSIVASANCETEPLTLTIEIANVRLCWNSRPNRRYQVEMLADASANTWTPVGEPILATGPQTCLLDGVVGNVRKFYRIVDLP